ncbi:hypothetical protein BKA81DRAFT_427727 [Phyllosticta paracitricarpa]
MTDVAKTMAQPAAIGRSEVLERKGTVFVQDNANHCCSSSSTNRTPPVTQLQDAPHLAFPVRFHAQPGSACVCPPRLATAAGQSQSERGPGIFNPDDWKPLHPNKLDLGPSAARFDHGTLVAAASIGCRSESRSSGRCVVSGQQKFKLKKPIAQGDGRRDAAASEEEERCEACENR